MTAGRGISHPEFSTPANGVLHGAQLWVALPDSARQMEQTCEHYRPGPLAGPGWLMRVILGSLAGAVSPVATHTPLPGAEITLEAGSSLSLDIDPSFEHGVLVDAGILAVDGHPVAQDHLAYLPAGTGAEAKPRFGTVPRGGPAPFPAPALPNARLRPRA